MYNAVRFFSGKARAPETGRIKVRARFRPFRFSP
jgi:hypothetical protein